ncbi:MAG: hypothetical protein KKE02_15740 [Alphaproteobacteria bacterium]|nr:hypothetical protein [Alphaproteobacteria bacterium]MBU1512738.1 hypothetical protein [Alphaproteobacteria bacterium]MBU2096117.1 hypothetical protein [Alphaproteobacteria bacterium]MBU2152473.1 hypothetical protein [Alphaproteobacteria bacterium]MBU2307993.1 hypothetical protein [Alphaproteobacteria bacterium]
MAIDGIGAMFAMATSLVAKPTDKADKTPSPADAAKTRMEASAARQKQDLDAVREKGIYAWAQEKKFEALKAKIKDDLMKKQGLDDAKLSAMSPETRASTLTSLEAEIAKQIQEVMQETLTQEAKKAGKEGRPPQPMIIDIAV